MQFFASAELASHNCKLFRLFAERGSPAEITNNCSLLRQVLEAKNCTYVPTSIFCRSLAHESSNCYNPPMITPEEIKHLATLSRIKITDEDMVSLVKEFDGILGYIDQLKKVDVSTDTEGRVGAVKNVTRDDTARTISASDREALLNEAPDREGDFIAVKKIIAQED